MFGKNLTNRWPNYDARWLAWLGFVILNLIYHVFYWICSCARWLVYASALLEFVRLWLFEWLAQIIILSDWSVMFVWLLYFGFEFRFFWAMMRPPGMMACADYDQLLSLSQAVTVNQLDHWIFERSELASIGTMSTTHSGWARFSFILFFVRLILFIVCVFWLWWAHLLSCLRARRISHRIGSEPSFECLWYFWINLNLCFLAMMNIV